MSTNTKIVAIVTGGASGLGNAIAREYVKNGIFTIIVGSNPEKTQKACEELGPNAGYEVCDLGQLQQIPDLINTIVKKYGRIDVLVNNAGIHIKKPLLEYTDEDFQRVVLINETAVFVMSREVGKVMVEQKSGSIINISSMATKYGLPKVIGYTAAKSAVEGMTRGMAAELSPFGIRVNCIAPGFIKTDMSSKALDNDPERKQRVFARTPMGRLGTPDDVAKTALYYATEASDYVTGTVLCVDGGHSIGF